MENSREEEKIINTTRLVLEKRHQLIDLNKEFVNFEISFECKALDASKDFEMLVINQDQLDSIDLSSLSMKRTRGGYISGNIVADEDKYQNYFLVIRACEENDPMEVDMTISIKPIPPNKEKLRAMRNETPMLPPSIDGVSSQQDNPKCVNLYVILLVVVVGGVLVYFLIKKRSKNKDGGVADDLLETKSVSSSGSSRSSRSSSPSVLKELIRNKKAT